MPVHVKGGGGAGFPPGWKENFKGVVHESAIAKGDPVVTGVYSDITNGMDSLITPPINSTTDFFGIKIVVSNNRKMYVVCHASRSNTRTLLFKNNDETFTSITLTKPDGYTNTSSWNFIDANFSDDDRYLFANFASGSYYFAGLYEMDSDLQTATLLWEQYSSSAPGLLSRKFIDLGNDQLYLISRGSEVAASQRLTLERFDGAAMTLVDQKDVRTSTNSASGNIIDDLVINGRFVVVVSKHSYVAIDAVYEVKTTGFSDLLFTIGDAKGDTLLDVSDSWQYAIWKTTSNYMTLAKNDGNDNYFKLPNPSIMPANGTTGCAAFDPSGTILVVQSSEAPYLILYKRTGDIFDKLPNPNSLPTGGVGNIYFSNDSKFICVCFRLPPYVCIYATETGKLVSKITNLSSTPLRWFPYNRHNIGVALDGGQIGTEIRVNLFPALNNI
jgi:hypothetical protein